eukprot:GHVN01094241.1.p1 GENE.GHVN01094241.1~~GHVN01094241.1.p1  ORF type:complete len:444 (-),score=38.22 GHVN01094241.1:1635-2966(-)
MRNSDFESLPFCLQKAALNVAKWVEESLGDESVTSASDSADNRRRLEFGIVVLCRALLSNNVAAATVETILVATSCQWSRLKNLATSRRIVPPSRLSADTADSQPAVQHDTCSDTQYAPTLSPKSVQSNVSTAVSGSPLTQGSSICHSESGRSNSEPLNDNGCLHHHVCYPENWLERLGDPVWSLALALYMACAWFEDDVISVGSLLAPLVMQDRWFESLALNRERSRYQLLHSSSTNPAAGLRSTSDGKPIADAGTEDNHRFASKGAEANRGKGSFKESLGYCVSLFDNDLMHALKALDYRLRVDLEEILESGVGARIHDGDCVEWVFPILSNHKSWPWKKKAQLPIENSPPPSSDSDSASIEDSHIFECPVQTSSGHQILSWGWERGKRINDRRYDVASNKAQAKGEWWEYSSESPFSAKRWSTSVTSVFDGYDCDPLDTI